MKGKKERELGKEKAGERNNETTSVKHWYHKMRGATLDKSGITNIKHNKIDVFRK